MKLAMFGATGTVGRSLLAQALQAGYDVRVLARDPSGVSLTDPRLEVVPGDALDPVTVKQTVAGCDAVLTTLGGYGDAVSVSQGTENIVAAMRAAGVRRLVVMQGYHLVFPGDPHNLGQRLIAPLLWLADRRLVPETRRMAEQIQAVSDIDWTVVRAPRVVDGPPTGRERTGILRLGPWSKVTNSDVAATMLTALMDNATVHTAPMVCTG
jgi:putative NADH-flavin reductase